jgi:hypothetical protein
VARADHLCRRRSESERWESNGVLMVQPICRAPTVIAYEADQTDGHVVAVVVAGYGG